MSAVHYLDPVAIRAALLLTEGKRGVVSEARMSYGQASDIRALTGALSALPDDGHVRIVDLSCAQSLGDAARLAPFIEYAQKHPVLVLLDAGVAVRVRETIAGAPFGLATIEYSDRRDSASIAAVSHFAETRAGDHPGVAAFLRDSEMCRPNSDARAAYKQWRGEWLTESVRAALQEPPEGHRWLGLGDGTAANYWLDIKQLLESPESAVAIAYHVAREITLDFRQMLDENLREKERTLVVGSNIAASVASLVRALLGHSLNVVVFDRLGPFAHVSRARLSVLQSTPPAIVVFEDVASTGRELDLITLLALTRGSRVSQAVSLFDLQVGQSRLVPAENYVAMAKPRDAIGYKRSFEKDVDGKIWVI